MNNPIRKGIAVILAAMVLFFTILSILAIWDIIEVEDILRKSLATMLIIFISSAVILFIFAIVYKEEKQVPNQGQGVNQQNSNQGN